MKISPKIPLSTGIILVSLLVIISASSLRLCQGLELLTYDLRFRLKPPLKVSEDILIITVDDLTLNQLGQWPIPRDFYASLLDVLTAYGAKTVVFDILFPESSSYDELFAQSMSRAKNVYLPVALQIFS